MAFVFISRIQSSLTGNFFWRLYTFLTSSLSDFWRIDQRNINLLPIKTNLRGVAPVSRYREIPGHPGPTSKILFNIYLSESSSFVNTHTSSTYQRFWLIFRIFVKMYNRKKISSVSESHTFSWILWNIFENALCIFRKNAILMYTGFCALCL